MAYSKARRLSDSISATGEVSAFVDGSITHADLHTDMDLTGKTVLVANASTGDSDTTVANTAFVQQEIAALVASAPGTLNTLNELAAALGDDASFSTTVTDSIATKLPLAGGTMTGNIAHAGNFTLDVVGDINLDADGANIILKDGGTQFGKISKGGGSDLIINASIADKDIFLTGTDGSTAITALTLDMSDAGTAIFSHDVVLADHGRVLLGNSSDLQLVHDGSNSYIDDAGTGILYVRGNDKIILGKYTGETMVEANVDGTVELYYDNAKKLATESGGVNVTGYMDADNFKINGGQGSDGQVLTSTGSGVAWEDVDSVTKSNSAPSSPAAGDLWFNTSSSTASGIRAKGLAVYSGTAWELMNSLFSATGGTITTSGAYTIHTFTSSGTFTPNGPKSVDWLVVAGGGGGGGNPSSDSGGGGGAGGFRTGTGFSVTAQAYTVTVGAGGAGGAQQNGSAGNGAKGGNSSFGSISSTGGGFGGGPTGDNPGGPGGSGGGGGSGYNTGTLTVGDPGAGNQGSYSPVEGYAGTATTFQYYWTAGGGGGAGGQPTEYTPGPGVANSYSGSSVTYAEGGDGQGGIVSVANTGNGGDGGGNAAANGRAGGSGIVIVRYLT